MRSPVGGTRSRRGRDDDHEPLAVPPADPAAVRRDDDIDVFGVAEPPPAADDPVVGPLPKQPRRAKRTPAPRAHFAFRWVVPAVLVVLAGIVVNLGLEAKDLVLNSRDGTISRNVTDPALPGFAAEVVPTPTLLVMHTSDAGELVGVVLMSLVSGDGGGNVAFFPSDLIISDGQPTPVSLGELYAKSGPDALRRAMTRLVDADVDASIDVGARVLEELIRPVAPLRYTLRDNVREVQNGATVTVLRSGPVAISTVDQVHAATEVLGPGEATINRVARQMAFWQAWLDALRAVPDKASVLPVYDSPIVRFVKSLSTGEAAIEQAPFDEAVYQGSVLHIADVDATAAMAARMIPYPQAYEPGQRLLVEVRNGIGDLTRNDPLIRAVVANGGQLVLLGNTEDFGVVASSVTYYSEDQRSRVETFAAAIGLSNLQFVDRPGSSIDVTVTIGADYKP